MTRAALIVAGLLAACVTTAPASAQIVVSCTSPALADCAGVYWHTDDVLIDWTVDPSYARVGCVDELIGDTRGAQRGCTASRAGHTASETVTVKVDQTPPIVTGATPSRAADANGWYRSPVQVAFSGTDATSGLLGCTTATYRGPDSGAASVGGVCRDVAGNVSAPTAFGLRYDTTAPTITEAEVVTGDHAVRLKWAVVGASGVQIWRSPGLHGEPQLLVGTGPGGTVEDERVRNGRRYRYSLSAVDPAGNSTSHMLSAVPGRRLLAPARGARVATPPLLRWTKVRGARYYNVQLFRNGHKILSKWPARPRLQLERTWRYRGKRRRLVDGARYRWLVWPGRGRRVRNEYGPLIGRRAFVVDTP
jgi:hypothetical protein